MVLFVVLAGLYAIGMVGYYKLAQRIMQETDPEVADMSLAKVGTGMLSVVWPVLLYWNLVQEARK